jgi:hypothetical protein
MHAIRGKGTAMEKLLPAALLLAIITTPAWSQVPNPCPPAGASSATTGAKAQGTDGTEAPDRQRIERSAIVPDAGGENESAAPTVQQGGKSVEAQTECPKPLNQINPPAR